ncbi:MAG: hypothetical protein C0620_10065 [Desulfuromonas sp.]|jgi:hypothetical protein|nr:MAG: hypothetical protein C0620_10065 [Desulfuromonas sp.]
MRGLSALILVIAFASPGIAGPAASGGDAGLLVWFFIGFVALFIVSQLIPGIILTIGVFRGLFTRNDAGKDATQPKDHVM